MNRIILLNGTASNERSLGYIEVEYSVFKAFALAPSVPFKEININNIYLLYAADGPFCFSTVILQDGGADQTDYEANLQPKANKSRPDFRLPQVALRTFIKAGVENSSLGAANIIHTVTANKIFFMTSAIISAVTTGGPMGRFILQNGTNNADKLSFITPGQPIGGSAGTFQMFLNMEKNPVGFSTDVRVIGLAGNVTASITFWGYEEPLPP